MKRLISLLYLLIVFVSLFSAQMYAVGELYSSLSCEYCPIARATLRYMSEGDEGYPYLISLIWQQDGANASPNFSERESLYGVSTLPHTRWGGTSVILGAGPNTPDQFDAQYNTVSAIDSNIDIELSFNRIGNSITAIANIVQEEPITDNTNTHVVFILTASLDAMQQGNYFASVVRYHTQAFDPFQEQYTQVIDFDPTWDLESVYLVGILQDFTPVHPIIYNAKQIRLVETPRPIYVRAYSNSSQISIAWHQPDSERAVVGYNIYKNGELIFSTTDENEYIDRQVVPNIEYSYEIETIFEEGLFSGKSQPCLAMAVDADYAQLGSGESENSPSNAGPINIFYKSLRGQFIYTKEELELAGLVAGIPIQAIGFYITQSPLYPLPNFHLRMKHTELSNLNAHSDGDWVIDHVIASYQPQAGSWRMINLPSHFIWDGTSNILIDTAFGLAQSYNSSGQVRIINYLLGYRYSRSDTQSQISATTTTIDNYKPQIRIYSDALSESDNPLKPITTKLGSNYPNPFNPSTTIFYDLQRPSYVVIEVFNIKGQIVSILLNEYVGAGRHFVNWNGKDATGQSVTSGVYLYRLQTSDYSETKRMILLK